MPTLPDAGSLVASFLHHEARLLDERCFEEWLSLFESDATYWVPMAWGQAGPEEHVSLIYESLELLTLRINRLVHKRTASQWPPSRTLHHIGNVEIEDQGEREIVARSSLVYVEYRRNEQRLFAGRVRHLLVSRPKGFGIKQKRVQLLNCDADVGHLRLGVPF